MANTTKKYVGALLLSALVGPAIGCASKNKQAEAPPPTPAEQAVSQLDSDRSAYVSQTQSRIDQMNKFSTELRTQAAQIEASDKVKAKKMQNASDDLNSLLDDVRSELADVTSSLPENWLDEKRDVDKSMARAESQYSNSVTLMK